MDSYLACITVKVSLTETDEKFLNSNQYMYMVDQGCIFRLTCSHRELTEDHVLTSAYVKFFRTAMRNAVNEGV